MMKNLLLQQFKIDFLIVVVKRLLIILTGMFRKNINRTTNIMDNPKYVSNNIYTGIYLINYSISRNYNVDIHDEMLKRKEYELFRINHTKNTTFNRMNVNLPHEENRNLVSIGNSYSYFMDSIEKIINDINKFIMIITPIMI
ncbi:erythrocyte membrane protein 1 [Plasmodium falciparum IGH-CR14]|uniref:Erythrocyte membrane protein 1 n=3 Tax=Plasmodium falciparum TaxID=5833 RepID=A0A0L1I501_PLAFA|nr:erythrocyte membrane protein 1 [Plasmodium falciparum IGH-CR14]